MRMNTYYKFAGIGGLAVAIMAGSAVAEDFKMETPQHGGTVEIAPVYPTISALSWDNYDWSWKLNYDAGQIYEQLFAADMSKARSRGGPAALTADGYVPAELMHGELAENWEIKEDPLQIVITLRQGIMFPEKPGVMASRELTAEDVVFTYDRLNSSPKKNAGVFDYIDSAEATDKYTVVFNLNEYNAEWSYRFGWGYYSAIVPKEVTEAPDGGAGNWKNVNGTGPYRLTDHVKGNSNVYERNPVYWGTETVNGETLKLPYADKLVYRIIQDEATRIAGLRTGQLDIMELVRWQDAESLKKSTPDLKWNRWLAPLGTVLAMRMDTKPFDDLRVRRALNMAINKQEIIDAYYQGNAEMLAYPQYPDFGPYYRPLDQQPASVQELFEYNPEKAKALLAEAGYPDGFTFKTQVCSCQANHMDLLPMVAGYLEQIGVTIEIEPMEYGAFLSAMTTFKNAPGYFADIGHSNPTRTLQRLEFGQVWNPAQFNDPAFEAKLNEAYLEKDETALVKIIDELTTDVLDKAPYIWMPTPYNYTAWWPWVKGYEGELRSGAVRPGPIHARLWVDQELKKKMGY